MKAFLNYARDTLANASIILFMQYFIRIGYACMRVCVYMYACVTYRVGQKTGLFESKFAMVNGQNFFSRKRYKTCMSVYV